MMKWWDDNGNSYVGDSGDLKERKVVFFILNENGRRMKAAERYGRVLKEESCTQYTTRR